MKTLRNILPMLILVLTVSIAEAQKNKIYSAQTNIDAYLSSKNPDDLLQAKQIIDEVVKHEKTIEFWKAWYTYGKVYQFLGSDSIMKMTDRSYPLLAIEGYKKAFDLSNGRMDAYTREDIVLNQRDGSGLNSLAVLFLNEGIDLYEKADYSNALDYFLGVVEVDSLLTTHENEGVSFVNYAHDLVVRVYINKAQKVKEDGDNYEEFYAIIKEAQKRYPLNSILLTQESEYYKIIGDNDKALSVITDAVSLQKSKVDTMTGENPTEKEILSALYLSEGLCHYELSSLELAITSFKNAIDSYYESSKAHYLLGACYYQRFLDATLEMSEQQDGLSDEAYYQLDQARYNDYLIPAEDAIKEALILEEDNSTYQGLYDDIQILLEQKR